MRILQKRSGGKSYQRILHRALHSTVPDDIRKAHEQAMRKADGNSKNDVIVVRGRHTVKSFDFFTLKMERG